MTPDQKVLSRVKHRFTGEDHGVFHSPTRNDRKPSCTFRILPDGRFLIHDHGGDSVQEILAAVGLRMEDLYPEPITGRARPEPRPFPAADCLRAVAFETTVTLAIAAAMLAGEPFDRERLALAAERINGALSAAGLGVL